MKLVNDNLDFYISEAILNTNTTPIYRVRMVGDIEFTQKELEEYMSVNGLEGGELKKAATGIAKVKWRNAIKKALETSDVSQIDDKQFKWNIK